MNEVNRTLYIPLYGKAEVSRKGVILSDPTAEAIWAKEGFELRGKARSKWLSYYMGMRSAVFDGWLREQTERLPGASVLHIGCGMDSRCLRVGAAEGLWFDVDFPEVIAERKKYYTETESCRMIGADARELEWLEAVPSGGAAVVVMEGFSMYLERRELLSLLSALSARFSRVLLLMDCYTVFAARASKYKNPVNEVGVTRLYGVDEPEELTEGTGLRFTRELEFTPPPLVEQLRGFERAFFKFMFTGGAAKKMYRLFEYQK